MNRQALSGQVLVVDDDKDVRHMITTVLEAAGAGVTEASSSEEAMASLGKTAFDACVLDWNLAATTGESLLSSLKSGYPNLFARTVVVTGDLFSDGNDHESSRFGRPVLAKPFRPHLLVEMLAGLLA
ncbi:MAG: response regulator [Deltaproteobacteria bacterium]|jgi:two-component system chemotaxis sensor kinase CheA